MVREEALGGKLKQLWGDVDVIGIGSGFFLAKCGNQKAYDLALIGGPWLIYDHYISVQPWKEDFDLDEEEVTSIAAWIRIAKLPMDYYDEGIIHVIGNQIGYVLKIDKITTSGAKGRFARVCVYLDLKQPLQPVILVNVKEKKVEYEWLHRICFNCGKYGHDTDYCSEGRKRGKKGGKGMERGVQLESSLSVPGEPTYGGWMVVQQSWKGKRVPSPEGKGRESRNHSNENHG
ncbi:uncharacterized protein LOC114738926 [Neltuma alba]|uniref:uncharacterized protein LOC114738926 n=1 Tax=Neltuma alba TaxID=207710 RepID=UPI0010A367C8|nr:uncharacterized protein LOC114738926 [Prosopis alba]